MNYRLKTIRQEQANLLNELRAAETWVKDKKRELWLKEQIAWNIKDMGQDLLRLWDWIVELDLRHNELACVVADYDWEGQQQIIEELLANYIQSLDVYLRIRKSPLPHFGKGGIFEVDDGNTVKKLEMLRRKAEWCLHPDDSFMDTPEVQEAIARAEEDINAGRIEPLLPL
ncbi:MAG: hypothetical protein ACE5PV_00765 [Candidatus Poribacteria bacterium]